MHSNLRIRRKLAIYASHEQHETTRRTQFVDVRPEMKMIDQVCNAHAGQNVATRRVEPNNDGPRIGVSCLDEIKRRPERNIIARHYLAVDRYVPTGCDAIARRPFHIRSIVDFGSVCVSAQTERSESRDDGPCDHQSKPNWGAQPIARCLARHCPSREYHIP